MSTDVRRCLGGSALLPRVLGQTFRNHVLSCQALCLEAFAPSREVGSAATVSAREQRQPRRTRGGRQRRPRTELEPFTESLTSWTSLGFPYLGEVMNPLVAHARGGWVSRRLQLKPFCPPACLAASLAVRWRRGQATVSRRRLLGAQQDTQHGARRRESSRGKVGESTASYGATRRESAVGPRVLRGPRFIADPSRAPGGAFAPSRGGPFCIALACYGFSSKSEKILETTPAVWDRHILPLPPAAELPQGATGVLNTDGCWPEPRWRGAAEQAPNSSSLPAP